MRLTSEVFEAMDHANADHIRQSNLIASGGRFGLYAGSKPFELSINVLNNILEVVTLSCHGLTKSGRIIDLDFDSGYTKSFDTRIHIPEGSPEDVFLLLISVPANQWRESDELHSEPAYTFRLITENMPIDDDSLPIGRVINQYGWRLDETNFVPPCLYVNAHHKYLDLYHRVKAEIKEIYTKCGMAHNCVLKHLLQCVWQGSAEAFRKINGTDAGLRPEELFSAVQAVVTSFVIGCEIEERIALEDPVAFRDFSYMDIDLRNLYDDIHRGLELSAQINVKMGKVIEMSHIEPEPPTPAPPKPEPPKPNPGRNRWEGIVV